MSILEFENIRYVPSIHQRMAFADEVERAVQEWKPDCIAVELPPQLQMWIVRGVLRLPQISAVCHPNPTVKGDMFYVPIDPSDSLVTAVRIAIEREFHLEWLDAEPGTHPYPEADLPDDLMIDRIGLETYVETALPYLRPNPVFSTSPDAMGSLREETMAERLRDCSRRYRRVLCVLGLAHFPAIRRKVAEHWKDPIPEREKPKPYSGAFLAHVHPKSLSEVLREIPHVACQRETEMHQETGEARGGFDKLTALRQLFMQASRRYRDQYRAEISLNQLKGLFQYTRNLSLILSRLQPETYEMVIGAKNMVDGDYGYEVHELAGAYGLQEEESALPELKIRKNRGSFSDRDERFHMVSDFGEQPTETLQIRFRRRPSFQLKERWKEEWEQWDLRGICSWPPEDERQEKFMTFMRRRALQVVSDDKEQVVEFTTSFLDGLDIRETTRNWYKKKIYVRQSPQPHGKCGAVVLIFEDESQDKIYSWRSTLYAENRNESDIAFYATPLGENVVGPRISRTRFGGILSVYPAPRMPDIWSFPGVAEFGNCAETLLVAGILFSGDKYVAYIAHRPPPSRLRDLAAQNKKHLIYLPIKGFPPAQLKRIQNFHILNGHDVRAFAADYIFEE